MKGAILTMTENNYTIAESYELPSKGLIYDVPFDGKVKLRAMTTADEMKRLSPSELPYKTMSEIIDDCLITKLPISVYDLCIGDYQFLLHKLRIVTYGPDYKVNIFCPNCGNSETVTINLDELDILEYTEEIESLKKVSLPVSKKEITLKIQTPRTVDYVTKRTKEIKQKNKELQYDPSLLVTLESLIETIDGEKPSALKLESFVRTLSMRDANILLQSSKRLNAKIGIGSDFATTCTSCGYRLVSPFRYTSEFFGPSID